MTELKCWKKLKKSKGIQGWNKTGNPDHFPYVYLGRGYFNSSEKGWKEKYPFTVGVVHFTHEDIIKENVKTKSQALKLAKKYMKSHDKC